MRRHFLKSVSWGVMIAAVLFSTSCKEDQLLTEEASLQKDRDNSNAKLGLPSTLDVNEFAIKIENHLEDKVGFGYAIYKDGQEFYRHEGGDGFARKHFEGDFQKHSALAKQEVLTTTQYVTAVATLKILEKYNLPLTTKVWNYLPKHWNPSAKFRTLSFERLLAHKTGLIYYYNEWDKVKLTVEGPIDEVKYNSNNVHNNDINYLLLGIIIPFVEATELKKQGDASKWNKLNAVANDFGLYGEHYRDIVRKSVFTPADLEHASVIDWRTWGPTGPISMSKSSKGYPSRNGDEPGVDKVSVTWHCGVTGLYMNASQFGKLASKVAKGNIISMISRNAMKTKLLGFDGKLNGTRGNYFYKTGVGYNCKTIFIDFGTVQVAVFTNSPQSNITDPTVLALMFENSFVNL